MKAKAEYVRDQQNEFIDDPKKFWQNIASLVPSKKKKSGKVVLVDEDRKEELVQEAVPDHINTFFGEEGPKLAEKMHD